MKKITCPHCANDFHRHESSAIPLVATAATIALIIGLAIGVFVSAIAYDSPPPAVQPTKEPPAKKTAALASQAIAETPQPKQKRPSPIDPIVERPRIVNDPPVVRTQQKPSLTELQDDLRKGRVRLFQQSFTATRFGLMDAGVRKRCFEAAKEVKEKGLRNVNESTIAEAEFLVPEWVMRLKKKDGRDISAEKIVLFAEYRRYCANSSEFRDVMNDEQFFEEVLDIDRPDKAPTD